MKGKIEELEKRFAIFKDNLHEINNHNSQGFNYTLSINQFTDLSFDEFKTKYVNGYKSINYGCKPFSSSYTNLPESIDWRDKGAVTSVKDQGQCGSCWSFSSTGSAESSWFISKNELLNLSEQQLVDCASGRGYYNLGCNGGEMDSAFKYLITNGQCSDTEYPYTSGVTQTSGDCKKCQTVAHFSSCSDVKSNDQLSLKNAVNIQSVSVAIEADTRYFQFYSGGVLDSVNCGTNLDHGVLVVGYGVEDGQKYWIVKNSWGVDWGENGYIRIARSDSTNDPGICGISVSPSFISV
jgi:C1A family cysteine protease